MPAPYDHFGAGPYRGVIVSSLWRIDKIRCCPTVGSGIISAAALQLAGDIEVVSSPHDHFRTGPYGRMGSSHFWSVNRGRGYPAVRIGIVFPTGVQFAAVVSSPDDHFVTSPNRGVTIPTPGRVNCTGGCPTVGDGIVSSSSIEMAAAIRRTAPNDHLISSPHRCVIASGRGCTDGACSCPAISGWIVFVSSIVSNASNAAPDNHFATSPNGSVSISGIGRADCRCPGIVNASRAIRYFWQRVASIHCCQCRG